MGERKSCPLSIFTEPALKYIGTNLHKNHYDSLLQSHGAGPTSPEHQPSALSTRPFLPHFFPPHSVVFPLCLSVTSGHPGAGLNIGLPTCFRASCPSPHLPRLDVNNYKDVTQQEAAHLSVPMTRAYIYNSNLPLSYPMPRRCSAA